MTRRTRTALFLGLGGLVAAGLVAGNLAFAAPSNRPSPQRPVATAQTATADATVVETLSFMREEERLAREVYQAIAAQYNNALPFANIVTSEQRHFDSIGRLLVTYGVADPSAGRPAGDYAFPELTALYNELMTQAKQSLAASYDVGIAIEKRDIADLEERLAKNLPANVANVLTQLKAGSVQHLSAFESAKAGKGAHPSDGKGTQARGNASKAGAGASAKPGPGSSTKPGPGSSAKPGPGTGTCDGTGTRPQDGTGAQRGAGQGRR